MILELLRAFAFIFLAEMGDKTQILAMAFATKYKLKHVVIGIAIGSLLNHGIAVALGASLNRYIDPTVMGIIAGFAFVTFGLWSLKLDLEDEEEVSVSKYGPISTVALAFFIGELGDKTQLTAITLSSTANYPVFVLMGTVLGMIVTGLIGILVGIKLGSKIPDFQIKLGAAVIFYVLGVIKLWTTIPNNVLTVYTIVIFFVVTLLIAGYLLQPVYTLHKTGQLSMYRKTAEALKQFYQSMEESLDVACLGNDICGGCDKNKCLIGYAKQIIQDAKNKQEIKQESIDYLFKKKKFDERKIVDCYIIIAQYLITEEQNNQVIHHIRLHFEKLLFDGETIAFSSLKQYQQKIQELSETIYNRVDWSSIDGV